MFFKTIKGKSVPTKALYAVVAVCVAALCLYVGLRVVDSMRFSKLKTDVIALGDRMVAVAPTDKSKAVQYCKYSSLKYWQGNRTCHADYYGYYQGTSAETGSDINNDIVDTIDKEYKTRKITDKFSRKNEIGTYAFKINNTTCYYQSFYYDKLSFGPWTVDFFGSNEKVQGLVVSVGCSGAAMAEHYPLHGQR